MFQWHRVAAVILACSTAGVLYGKALKIKQLIPAAGGVSENPDCDGMAVLNAHEAGPNGDRTEIHVHISGFLPETVYGVQVDPGVTNAQAITTSSQGSGHWNFSVASDITGTTPLVRVFRWDGVVATSDQVSFDELRAIGCLSGNCPIGDPCTTDADCDDFALCTTDTCTAGFCFRAPVTCDDGNACTADYCDNFDGHCGNDLLPDCTP